MPLDAAKVSTGATSEEDAATFLARLGDLTMAETKAPKSNKARSSSSPASPLDLSSLGFAKEGHTMSNTKCQLPDGTFRTNAKGYEAPPPPAEARTGGTPTAEARLGGARGGAGCALGAGVRSA